MSTCRESEERHKRSCRSADRQVVSCMKYTINCATMHEVRPRSTCIALWGARCAKQLRSSDTSPNRLQHAPAVPQPLSVRVMHLSIYQHRWCARGCRSHLCHVTQASKRPARARPRAVASRPSRALLAKKVCSWPVRVARSDPLHWLSHATY